MKNNSIKILDQEITVERVQEVIKQASKMNWGTHLVRWRYDDLEHQGVKYKKGSLIPTDKWHLLKRIYIDRDWPDDTTIEKLSDDAKKVILDNSSEIWIYGYYRTSPPRLQWGFYSKDGGIAVVYDEEADLIATVFKPIDGSKFFDVQISAHKIDREKWGV